MAQSKVLYIHVTGLSSEVLKNLVLAGIRAVLCDGRPYPEAVKETPLLFLKQIDRQTQGSMHSNKSVAEVLQSKVEELNPLLGECAIYNTSPADLTDEFVAQFQIVLCSHVRLTDAIRISRAVTAAGHQFFMADCFGLNGAAIIDLGQQHTYRPEVGKKLLDVQTLGVHYVPLEVAMLQMSLQDATNRFHKSPPNIWIQYRCLLEYVDQHNGVWPTTDTVEEFVQGIHQWLAQTASTMISKVTHEELRLLARTASAEVAPVCSILGGVLGNEIIKAISGKGEPANNTLLFDGSSCKLWNFLVRPKL